MGKYSQFFGLMMYIERNFFFKLSFIDYKDNNMYSRISFKM